MNFIEEVSKPVKPKLSRAKKIWRMILIFFCSALVLAAAYIAFLVATGSKAFENGLAGGTSIIKNLYGKESLKGEDTGRINILVMGMGGVNHPGGMLADTLMIISVRTSDNKVALLSIPRDLQVTVPGAGENKINATFATGYMEYMNKKCAKKSSSCQDSALAAGASLTSEVVATVTGLPIHYYVTVDFLGFEKLIDQIGGVDVNVEKSIYDPYYPDAAMRGYEPFRVRAGQQHFDGKTALKFARSRHTSSDFDRAARQQQIIYAVRDKIVKLDFLSNPKKIADLVSNLGSSIKTNLTLGESKTLFERVKGVSQDKVVAEVLKSGPDGLLVDYNNGIYYLKPKTGNFKEIQNFAKNIFDQQVKENAKIEIQNGSKLSGIGSVFAKEMKDSGYDITNILTAKEKVVRTQIIDLSGGSKSNTLSFLQKRLNANITVSTKKSTDNCDIRIILGDDFTPES